MGGGRIVMKRSFLIYGAGGYLLEEQSNMDMGGKNYYMSDNGYVCRIYDGIMVLCRATKIPLDIYLFYFIENNIRIVYSSLFYLQIFFCDVSLLKCQNVSMLL
jgi:hypothetical protein